VAAGVIAVVSAGAAAIAAVAVLPGTARPAAQHAQDTAYVVSHAAQALDAVPAGTVFYMRQAIVSQPTVIETWARGPAQRIEKVTPAGQVVSESGTVVAGTTITSVQVSYQHKTWARSSGHLGRLPAAAKGSAAVSCDVARTGFPIPENASGLAASLRTWASCGALKASGTATIGGVTAIRLTHVLNGVTYSWYVSPATYLPFRMTTSRPGILLVQDDYRWLQPTTVNLAMLSLPAAPHGFTKVSMPTLP
jgi:hypothetical protein